MIGLRSHLYLTLEIHSGKNVGRKLNYGDFPDHATHLVRLTELADGNAAQNVQPLLLGDNGSLDASLTERLTLEFVASRGIKCHNYPYGESVLVHVVRSTSSNSSDVTDDNSLLHC